MVTLSGVYHVREQDVEGIELPGRNWKMLINEAVGCKHITFGLAEFPVGSNPGGHTHQLEEEIIYILQGTGKLRTETEEVQLEPGVAVYVPPGVEHAVVNDGAETIRLITLFSPQVVPGSYDKKNG